MLIGLLAVFAFLAGQAQAQVQTGSILVKATDEQGSVMPGVTVTLSSPMLVAGQTSGTTDAGGVIRFPSLTPGVYSVKFAVQGFQTLVRENIVVQVGSTVPLDVALKMAKVAETVTVSAPSPVVDTTTANVHVTLSQQLLQETPGGRDIWALLEYKVPGLVMSRPDVGGTNGGLQGTYSARGTPSSQNSQFLNGVNVGDPASIGAAGYYYDFDAFDEIQVSTGAHDISVPTSGVFLNMATKTGGRKWAGQGTFTWEGAATQSRNIAPSSRTSDSPRTPTRSTTFRTSVFRRVDQFSRTRSASSGRSATGASTSTSPQPSRQRCSMKRTSRRD